MTPLVSNDEISGFLNTVAIAPNPTDTDAQLFFKLREDESIQCSLHNIIGERIKTLFTGSVSAQQTAAVDIPLDDVSSGIYIVRVSDGRQSIARKLLKQ